MRTHKGLKVFKIFRSGEMKNCTRRIIPLLDRHYYYSCHYNSVQALCNSFALWTSARCFYGEHLLTLHIYIPFLTDFSTFNSAMVDFNNFLSMITKGLKATWQHFTLTWQNQSTKLLYNLLYFCPTANFIKNTISGNIQPFFYNSGISTQLIHSSGFYSLLF